MSDGVSVQHHPVLLMESYTCDGGSYLSPSPPKVTSSVLYHKEQELQSQSSTFITAL
ncbi:hypothetical protein cypCar_00048819 [Cyprinus carpio]|nr:hypothetical protein cypCar_00048819 [Cyprinus carpio]